MRTANILESSIISAIDKMLSSCSLDLKKIDAIAIGLGPGSFTSLRVGLSTVKGFVLALNMPVIGVGSLDVIASAVAQLEADEICVIADARRSKVYTAIYDKNLKLKTEYVLTTIEDVLEKVHGTTLFVGDGLELYREQIENAYKSDRFSSLKNGSRFIFAPEKFWYPQAKELAKLGVEKFKAKKFNDPTILNPIYLYPQDCQVDKK